MVNGTLLCLYRIVSQLPRLWMLLGASLSSYVFEQCQPTTFSTNSKTQLSQAIYS
jgi:hypothetical protein